MIDSNVVVLSMQYGMTPIKYLHKGDMIMCSNGQWHKISKLNIDKYTCEKELEFSDGEYIMCDKCYITINIGTQYKIKCSADKLENTPYQMDYFKGYGDTLEKKKDVRPYHDLYRLGYKNIIPENWYLLSLNERKEILAGIVDSYIVNACYDKISLNVNISKSSFALDTMVMARSVGFACEMETNNKRILLSIYKSQPLLMIPSKVPTNRVMFNLVHSRLYLNSVNLHCIAKNCSKIEVDSGDTIVFGYGLIPISFKE